MDMLSRNCQELKILTFPRPEGSDFDFRDYKDHVRWIERDLEQLRKIDAASEKSNRVIHGKPFAETLQMGQKIIAENKLKMGAAYAVMPNPKALEEIDKAIWSGQMGAKYMTYPGTNQDARFSAMSASYESYENYKKHAVELDSKVLEYRKAELKKCDESFVVPFLVLRDKREKENAIKKSIAETSKHAEAVKRDAEKEADWKTKTDIAKAKGFTAPYEGIVELIGELNDETQTLKEAKTLLVFTSDSDQFELASTSDKYSFYTVHSSFHTTVQIAVEKDAEAFYGVGSRLKYGMFKVIGSERFPTVLGAGRDLLILKGVAEK